MSFFDKFKKDSRNDGGKKTEEIMQQRASIKDTFRTNLRALGFTTMEIEEVILVIEDYERKIEYAKMKLDGSNINNPDPTIIMHDVHEEIGKYRDQMAADIKAKVEEIKQRKQAWRGE